jgi:hypothetical protein
MVKIKEGRMSIKVKDWESAANEAGERDPRVARYGYHIGSSCVHDNVSVFLWFNSIQDLAEHLLEVEPKVFELESADELDEYQIAVKPILGYIEKDGLSSTLLAKLNEAIKDHAVIFWWGTFDDLLKGENEFARDTLDRFLSEEQEGGLIQPNEMDEFVDYLKEFNC